MTEISSRLKARLAVRGRWNEVREETDVRRLEGINKELSLRGPDVLVKQRVSDDSGITR